MHWNGRHIFWRWLREKWCLPDSEGNVLFCWGGVDADWSTRAFPLEGGPLSLGCNGFWRFFFWKVSMRKTSCSVFCFSLLCCVSYGVSSYLSLSLTVFYTWRWKSSALLSTVVTKNTENVSLYHLQGEDSYLSLKWCDHSWKNRSSFIRPVQ